MTIPVTAFSLKPTSDSTLDRRMSRAEKLIALEKEAEYIGRRLNQLVPRMTEAEWGNVIDALRHPERQSLEPRDVAEAEARRVYGNIQDDLEKERSE